MPFNPAVRGLLIIVVTLLIAGVAGLAVLERGGQRLLSVHDAGAWPAFGPGDAVIVRLPEQPRGLPADFFSYYGWQVLAVVPGLGKVLDALSRPMVLAVVVYLPAGLVMAAEVRRLARVYARPFYSVRL